MKTVLEAKQIAAKRLCVNGVLTLCAGLVSLTAQASAYQGYVQNVSAYADGNVYVIVGGGTFDPSAPTSPCPGPNNTMFYVIPFNPASSLSQAYYAAALTAKATGKLVYISGNGVCAGNNPYNGGGSETIQFLDLKG